MNEEQLNQMVEDQTQETQAQDLKRYMLVEIVEKREELREISENTLKALQQTDPEFAITMWELVPIVATQFLQSMIDFLATRKTKEVKSIEIELGNTFTMGIEFTAGLGEKDGSFNPFINIGEELKLDGDMSSDAYTVGVNGKWVLSTIKNNLLEIKDISIDTIAALKRKYKMQITNEWGAITFITIYFLREIKNYLDAHKDQFDLLEIPVANVFTLGVEKVLGDDDKPEFYTYMTPGQRIKLATKDDNETELE